jgi:hypothetical protein
MLLLMEMETETMETMETMEMARRSSMPIVRRRVARPRSRRRSRPRPPRRRAPRPRRRRPLRRRRQLPCRPPPCSRLTHTHTDTHGHVTGLLEQRRSTQHGDGRMNTRHRTPAHAARPSTLTGAPIVAEYTHGPRGVVADGHRQTQTDDRQTHTSCEAASQLVERRRRRRDSSVFSTSTPTCRC